MQIATPVHSHGTYLSEVIQATIGNLFEWLHRTGGRNYDDPGRRGVRYRQALIALRFDEILTSEIRRAIRYHDALEINIRRRQLIKKVVASPA